MISKGRDHGDLDQVAAVDVVGSGWILNILKMIFTDQVD